MNDNNELNTILKYLQIAINYLNQSSNKEDYEYMRYLLVEIKNTTLLI